MNVSFTRARSKLVIFGSRKTLQGEPLLAQFFDLMQGHGWILPLPAQAHTAHAHVFDVCSTPSKRGAGANSLAGSRVGRGDGEDVAGDDASPRKLRGKENTAAVEKPRPMKKMKVSSVASGGKVKCASAGVVKGRPILQDLLGNET
jgi:DNA replication ATP-dependent helicase Dna2